MSPPRQACPARRRSGWVVVALAWLCLGIAPWTAAAPPPGKAAGPKPVEVDLVGLEGELLENAEAALTLASEAAGGEPMAEWRVRRLHRRAPAEIARALEPFGRYRPEIDPQLEEAPKVWRAVYRVEPGPAIPLNEVDVELVGPGADDPELREAVSGFPLKPGQALSHPRYERTKRRLKDRAVDRGYFDARYRRHEVRVDLESYHATIHLQLKTGARHRFGDVTFDQDFLIPELLRSYLTFRPGEPFDQSLVAELRQRLSATPYFSAVEIRPRPEQGAGLEVPVRVKLTPRPQRKWTIGAGFGTDTGPRGRGALEVRRFGRRGHRGRLETKLSGIRSAFEATYEIPGGRSAPRVIALTTGYRDESIEDGQAQTLGAGIQLTRQEGGWRQSFGLAFDLDDFRIGVDSGRSELLAPQIGFSYVRADDRIVPRRGYRATFELRGARDGWLSNASYLQARVGAKGVVSMGESWRLLGRFEAGYTETEDFRNLPPSVRFFAGGDQSVRGYDFRDLGRRDREGNVIGGETLVEGSLELERQIYEGWGAAVFVDAGNALETFDGPLRTGAGFGVRWRSPIGMIRADLAWALSLEETPIRFHFTVGPDL